MDFPLPPVGEGLIEVELVRWLVAPGDAVKRGQSLALHGLIYGIHDGLLRELCAPVTAPVDPAEWRRDVLRALWDGPGGRDARTAARVAAQPDPAGDDGAG